jgi:threonine dehydrogenase-like Zn-dependent dehydrogenase
MNFEMVFDSDKGFRKEELKNIAFVSEHNVLVEIKYVGICGSDFFYMNKYRGENLRLGHEWVGVVKESNSLNFSIGDMVTSTATWGCGKCAECLIENENQCLDNIVLGSEKIGMLRTQCVIDEKNLILLEGFTLKSAALLEVAAVGHKIACKAKIEGDDILILGAGPVGLLSAISLKEQGLDPLLIDVEPNRVERAKKLGIRAKILGETLLLKTKYDVVVDCTGDSNEKIGGWKYLPYFVRPGSYCLIVGHYEKACQFDSHLFGKFALRVEWLKGISGNEYKNSITFWRGRLENYTNDLITGYFKLEDVSEAYKFASNLKKSLKTLVEL